MPRNRDDWNILESHIRDSSHDLLGMNSTLGANQIRKLSKLIYRHVKIHKDRDLTIEYIDRKLNELREAGFIEAYGSGALDGLFGLLHPIWDFTSEVAPISPQDLPGYGEQDGTPNQQLPEESQPLSILRRQGNQAQL